MGSVAWALILTFWMALLFGAAEPARAEESLSSPGATELDAQAAEIEAIGEPNLEPGASVQANAAEAQWFFPPRSLEPLFHPGARPKLPRVDLIWVDAKGKVARRSFEQKSRWTWVRNTPESEGLSPVLRTLLILPEGTQVESFDSAVLRRVEADQLDWKAFAGRSVGPSGGEAASDDLPADRILIVDSGSPQATGNLVVSRMGKSESLGLVIRMGGERPLLWSHTSCIDRGIVLGDPTRTHGISDAASSEFAVAPFLYAAIHCRDEGGRVRILFSRSSDVEVQGQRLLDSETGDWLAVEGDPNSKLTPGAFLRTHEWLLDPERKPKNAALRDGAFTEVAALRLEGGDVTRAGPRDLMAGIVRAGVWEGQVSSANRTGITSNFGLGVSSLDYSEDAGQTVRSSSVQFTLNGGALWRFHPRWDVSASGFVNTILLSEPTFETGLTNLSNAQSPGFYGLNGRTGWRFSTPRGTLDWRLAGGIYYWGMLVEGNRYGIQSLMGPQFFVSVRNNQRKSRPWGGYLKYALTGNSFGFLPLENFELAIGGDVQVASIFGRALAASLDWSSANFSDSSVGKSMSLSTLSLGLKLLF
jgi:hypothetical protein